MQLFVVKTNILWVISFQYVFDFYNDCSLRISSITTLEMASFEDTFGNAVPITILLLYVNDEHWLRMLPSVRDWRVYTSNQSRRSCRYFLFLNRYFRYHASISLIPCCERTRVWMYRSPFFTSFANHVDLRYFSVDYIWVHSGSLGNAQLVEYRLRNARSNRTHTAVARLVLHDAFRQYRFMDFQYWSYIHIDSLGLCRIVLDIHWINTLHPEWDSSDYAWIINTNGTRNTS